MALGGMILCAGLGTRLRPLTDLWPKPACPVLHQPLVAYNLALLKGAGVAAPLINTHHLAERMRAVATTAADSLGLALGVSHEATLLGTGGGLAACRAQLAAGTFYLLNGDFLFDVDLAAALAAHRRARAAATLVVQPMAEGADYRPLHGFPDGRLACLPGSAAPAGALPWHFTGVHVLEPEIFEHLEARPSGLFETGYRGLLARGATVQLHADRGAWRDIGAPEHLLTANLEAAAGRLPLRRFAALGRAQAISPAARVDGTVIDAIIGAGASIPRSARVERSVVFAGTQLREGEQLHRSIAAGDLRISAGVQPS